MGDEAARLQVVGPVEAPALPLEVLQQEVELAAPVIRAQHQHEVIPADVPDEIPRRVDALVQALRQAQQHFVALGVAVEVVEGLEAVDVHVADPCGTPLLKQATQALLDGHVAR